MFQPLTLAEVEKQIPRQYQTEIFTQAQQNNVIAVMDTGTGKTLIAITLIKWMTTRLRAPGEARKVVVFIVPKVPLVEQQREAIAQQTSLEARGYYGALDVDYWKREQWAKEFDEADVLVMTPRVLYDLLSHAHWSVDRISLLIFDEAHHCRKNNDYNQIMRDHYHKCDPARRPKVFGMTASPIWNVKNPADSLKELERNMNSRVLAVRDNIDELHKHAPKPKEIEVIYDSTPTSWLAYPYPTMINPIMNAERLVVRDSESKRFRTRYEATMESVGIIGAEYYLSAVVPRAIESLVLNKRRELSTLRKLLSVDDPAPGIAKINGQIEELEGIKALLVQQSAHFFAQSLEVRPEWLAPRVIRLAEILQQCYTADPACQCIIFAEQRQVVMVLSWILRHISYLRTMIRPTFITGHGGSTHRSMRDLEDVQGMSVKEQQVAVRHFRDGKANLLVATSVAEEGLDFQPCNLVIRFDALKTMVSYAQSRGRARQKASTYIIMRRSVPTEADKYTQFMRAEPQLKEAYQKRAIQDGEIDDDAGEDVSESDLRLREVYTTSTGAKLTYGNAIALISRLCAVLPIEPGLPVLKPMYGLIDGASPSPDPAYPLGFGFSNTLILPSALPLPRDQLHRQGPYRQNKREAKRAVAFDAARSLHQLGCFDDYLLPLQENNDREGVDADGEQFKPLDVDDVFESTAIDAWGDPWQEGQSLFCYPLQFETCIVAGLVTCAVFDLNDVNEPTGIATNIPRLDRVVVLEFNSEDQRKEQLQLMEKYTIFAKEWAISRRPFEGKLSCFFVKLTQDGLPDFIAMQRALESPLSVDWRRNWTEESRLIVMEKTSWLRAYCLLSVRKDITPSTLLSSIGRDCCEAGCTTYLEHYTLLEKNVEKKKDAKALKQDKEVVRKPSSFPPLSPDEPMVVLLPVRKRKSADSESEYLIPSSFIKSVSLEDELFRVVETFPSLLRQITAVVRARAVINLLKLPPYPVPRFAEALVIPGVVPKYNYDRLEFLGDTFLKLATSIHIFNKYPHRHEGQLSVLKDGSVRNTYLRGKAYRLGIYHYNVTDKVCGPKRWMPPVTTHTTLDGVIPYVKQTSLRRCLSDCVESLLGAGYLCGGLDGLLRTGTAIGLCFGGMEPWSHRYTGDSPSCGASTSLRLLQDTLGYEFRNPLLLLEALTHPTFPDSQTPSYQRLEFLGDAVVDVFIVDYLFHKFPACTAHKLTWMKHLIVCNSLLGAVAIRELGLYKHMLYMARRLDLEITLSVRVLEPLSYQELAEKWWEFDPPKALNDVLEAVLGAVLVDTNYDLQLCRPVLERLFKDILPLAHPDVPLHPVMELYMWAARKGCTRIRFEKSRQRDESNSKDTFHVLVHDTEISRSTGDSLSIAKCFAAYEAKATLSDPTSDKALHKHCNCEERRTEEARLREEKKALKRKEKDQEKAKLTGKNVHIDMSSPKNDGAYLVMDMDDTENPERGKLLGVVEPEEVKQIVDAILDDPLDAADIGAIGNSTDETDKGFAEIGRKLLEATEEASIHGSSEEDLDDDGDVNEEERDHHDHEDQHDEGVSEAMDLDENVQDGGHAHAADVEDEMAMEDIVLWPASLSARVRDLP
ncbi:hypothetical protein DACRYDRAFT_113750 [Dacryopinax primogenitus]|uniref:P-loop containing nucleoside triphosphate hydrolase protein n=1 Tax=Dacryopinax primogenitus (strain DJM 731) TaxID=1858805 RepID=M5GA65_DACPD|nr:uncharacterized protein DACRYDRAFT_113750 [Dacryopinax primogenitus]EJU05694.1 hypothetical protein DACRYDRAFT_113750 [Dacryopinax primogenitus]